MKKLSILFFLILFLTPTKINAQESNLYTSFTTAQKRASLYQNLTKNIKRELSYSISPDNEDRWMNVFATLELLQYRDKFVDTRIQNAFDSLLFASDEFIRSLIQLGYANYPGQFKPQLTKYLTTSKNPELFAFTAEYFLQNNDSSINTILKLLSANFSDQLPANQILLSLKDHLESWKAKPLLTKTQWSQLLQQKFLQNEIILYSFQRHNRDFPGIAILRSAGGNFINDSTGNIFSIPLLARSITGMPYYLRYGNTPQGIYKMNGFGVSMSSFIGPTPNIQLQMPGEVSLQTFFKDSTILDSVWNISYYQKLLPALFKNYKPMNESYYAGLSGRSEIIVHGTTINPDYYFGKPYFPHTPSEGCLTTSEIWNGKRIQSNQQLLINGLLKAGGGHGYCIVIDLDDKQAPVNIAEILPHIKDIEKQ